MQWYGYDQVDPLQEGCIFQGNAVNPAKFRPYLSDSLVFEIMYQLPDPAVLIIKGESRSSFDPAPPPEEPGYRIIFLQVITGTGNSYIAFGAYKVLIPEQVIAAQAALRGISE